MRFAGGKSFRRWSRSKIDFTLVLLLRETVNSELKTGTPNDLFSVKYLFEEVNIA